MIITVYNTSQKFGGGGYNSPHLTERRQGAGIVLGAMLPVRSLEGGLRRRNESCARLIDGVISHG